ncbi:hypothetical protein J6590_098118 [Homalodisca vitripennis]|nr:hypothetical protein J6590_098118 [Homalodisca vitripennis]
MTAYCKSSHLRNNSLSCDKRTKPAGRPMRYGVILNCKIVKGLTMCYYIARYNNSRYISCGLTHGLLQDRSHGATPSPVAATVASSLLTSQLITRRYISCGLTHGLLQDRSHGATPSPVAATVASSLLTSQLITRRYISCGLTHGLLQDRSHGATPSPVAATVASSLLTSQLITRRYISCGLTHGLLQVICGTLRLPLCSNT